MIVFDNVSYAYPGSAGRRALSGVSFRVSPGEVLAVAGANGSGKSTLARLADGLLLPDGGTVTVDGIDTAEPERTWDVRALVGMVFQDPDDQIVGTVVEEEVAFGPSNLGLERGEMRQRVDAALAAVGLAGLERREPHLLSEGQKQRVAIAGALAMRPSYLVLDEPTAMLDPAGRRAVLDLIDSLAHEHGHGVVHISHDAASIARADTALSLENGAILYEGPPSGLLDDAALLERSGLGLPAIGLLAVELRALGAPVPAGAMDAERVVGALWR